MAIAFVAETARVSNSGATCVLTVAPTSGNTLVVFISAGAGGRTYTVSDNIDGTTGWNVGRSSDLGGVHLSIYLKPNVTTAHTTITITQSGGTVNGYEGMACEFSGLGSSLTIGPTDQLIEASSVATHTCSASGVSSTGDTLALCSGRLTAGGTECNPSVSYTETPSGALITNILRQWGTFPSGCTNEVGTWYSQTARLGRSIIVLVTGSGGGGSTASGAGSTTGSSTVSGSGASKASAAGTVTSGSAVAGSGGIGLRATGSATGSSTVVGAGATLSAGQMIGSATGTSVVAGVLTATAISAGTAGGHTQVIGSTLMIQRAVAPAEVPPYPPMPFPPPLPGKTTPAQICRWALMSLGRLGATQPLDQNDLQLSYETLNAMLDAWRLNELLLEYDNRVSCQLEAGKSHYTVGPSGDFDIAFPPQLNYGSLLLDSDGQTIERPIGPPRSIRELPSGVTASQVSTDFPDRWFYQPTHQNPYLAPAGCGMVTVYPTPNNNRHQLVLWYPQMLNQFDHPLHGYYLRPGMVRALRTNLAMEIAPMFQVDPPSLLQQQAKAAYDWLQVIGGTPHEKVFDRALLWRRAPYNLFVDDWSTAT